MKSPDDYSQMQKSFYDNALVSADDIVGSYDWHENFPYETNLLYRYADIRLPIFSETASLQALDVGCGPGRMVARMQRYFRTVDGVDISPRLLEIALRKNPKNRFFESSGADLGAAPSDTYDFVYSTIALQHVAVNSVRQRILFHIRRVLKPGGKFTLQFAFLDTWPYRIRNYGWLLSRLHLARAERISTHAEWSDDKTDATATNGLCDVALGPESLKTAQNEFERIFDGAVEYWFHDIRIYQKNLRGTKHVDYWASHWIFFHGSKPMH